MLLDIFKRVYNLPQGSEFKREELEDALVDKFGNLRYNRYESWTHGDIGKIYAPRYAVELDTKQSIHSLYSYGTDYEANSINEALMIFFIKYGSEPESGTDEYFINYRGIFHEIVGEIYERSNISC